MASPRAESPASSPGASPEPMTPRTKIRALLATVDSSDDDNDESAKQSKKISREALQNMRLGGLSKGNASSQLDDEDESDVEIRPRGRMASRMQGAAAAKSPKSNVTTPRSTEEREDSQGGKTPEATRSEDATAEAQPDEEEDDMPRAHRRLIRKTQVHESPESVAPTREASPGLFVSPTRPSPTKSTHNESEESDQELPPLKSDRFKALVERKRQERLAREAAEEAKRAERRADQEKLASEMSQLQSDDDDHSGITDDEGGRKLTQDARPTRKASRKAIEEMNRETQRMARNMQLAHEAKTRKRITTASLFERFNFRPLGGAPKTDPKTSSSSRPATPHSDVEMNDAETPPSSPPADKSGAPCPVPLQELAGAQATLTAEQPTLPDMTHKSPALDKGKQRAIEEPLEVQEKPASKPKRQIRVVLPATSANFMAFDSDDELQVTTTAKDRIDAVFNKLPAKQARESRSLAALRALAHVKSPGKDKGRKKEQVGITPGELQAQLQMRARQQAKVERDRRLEILKAQGVIVQTAEERERQMQEVEDIVAKAREEAQSIMEQERAAAKKEKRGNGEADPLAWDDSDDEEYADSANEADAEASDLELSGSEEDEIDGDEEEEAEGASNPLFEVEADDSGSEAADVVMNEATEALGEEEEETVEQPIALRRRYHKHTAILSDDEDEAEVEATPRPKTKVQQTSPDTLQTVSPAAPGSVLRSAKKTFIPGLPVEGPAGLGLTQIFAGTMDDSQVSQANGPAQSMMPDFSQFPDSNFSATADQPTEEMILDSQREETQAATQAVQFNLSQSQMRGLDSLLQDESNTPASQVELSQDGGFLEYTPLKERFAEPPASTVETVLVSQHEEPQDSPLVRRGRLRRRMETLPEDGDELVPTAPAPTEKTHTAFAALKDGATKEQKRQAQEDFNRKKSKAKEIVQEQAEESEDEYAGLGGADGEDSDDESNASVKEMIDDAAGNDVDDRKLAAFYADRERANDEQQVEKLFKDITSGMLRRKRGADYDLSDSDDGGEARRRMKRRQFAKMQKALFSDERVKKMSENPGKQAFLRTIQDQASDDEMDFLDVVESSQAVDSQSQSQSQEERDDAPKEGQTVPDSQPRRALEKVAENRAPATMRRTVDGKKPSNIGMVRETLSDLLDEPRGSVIPATEAGSDSEDELAADGDAAGRSDKENNAPNPRRGRVAVVDRISLKRQSSSNMSTSTTTSTRLAFAASGGSASFRVPALLRRATTNSLKSISSTGSSGNSNASAGSGFGEEAKIKKTAGKKSGVGAFARENERRVKMLDSERKREEKKVQGAARRAGMVGGLLARGSFD